MTPVEPLRIGDIVRCVCNTPGNNNNFISPEVGHLYTVRGWDIHFEGFGIYLEEIQNEPNRQHPYSQALKIEPFFYWWQFEVIRRFPFEDLRDGVDRIQPPYHLIYGALDFEGLIETILPEFGVYSLSWNSKCRRKAIDLALMEFKEHYDYSYLMTKRSLFGVDISEVNWYGKGPLRMIAMLGYTLLPFRIFQGGYSSINELDSHTPIYIQALLHKVIMARAIPIINPPGISQVVSVESGAICRTDEGSIFFLNREGTKLNTKLTLIGHMPSEEHIG